jgi:hypothetical protein
MHFKPSKEFLKCYPMYKDYGKEFKTNKKSNKKTNKKSNKKTNRKSKKLFRPVLSN